MTQPNTHASISTALSFISVISFCCESSNPSLVLEEWDGKKITSQCYALVNGVVIDGTGAAPLRNAGVVIRGDRILAVGSAGHIAVPPDAHVIDVHGATILPGFINAHVHTAFDEVRLKTWAWNGVTTVRDEGIFPPLSLERAIAIRDSALNKDECARLVSAGFMITVPGGYGDLTVSSPDDARLKVIEELDKGVNLVKISQEDGYAGVHDLPKLSGEEMSAIVTAAHERGTLVSAHITQSLYWNIVAHAGIDDVAHVAYDTVPDSVLDAMVAKNILLVPTFTIFRNYGAAVSACIDNVRRFVQKGGNVALGNDYAGGPGVFEEGIPFYELDCMREAGMTSMEIIVACTRNAARVAHVDSMLGTIEPGKLADLLLLRDDPLSDLNALSRLSLVIHRGITIRSEQ